MGDIDWGPVIAGAVMFWLGFLIGLWKGESK